jgi:hypothetical protein
MISHQAHDPAVGFAIRQPTSVAGPSIPGLQLEPGERIIAVERPVLMKWTLVLTLMATVVMLPLALYYLLVRSGKAYVLTNRRVVRSDGPGKLRQIPLSDLDGYRIKSDFFVRNTSIVLLPRPGTPHPKVRFALLTPGPDSSLTRMWGALNLWALTPWISPDEAPEVDAAGKPVVPAPRIEVVVCNKTFLTAGLKIMPFQGAAVLTPSRVLVLRSEPITSGFGKIYPALPWYAYLAVKAASTNDLATFEAQLDWMMSQGDLSFHCFVWNQCRDVTMGRFKSLTFEHDGTKCGLAIQKQSVPAVTQLLRKYGIIRA